MFIEPQLTLEQKHCVMFTITHLMGKSLDQEEKFLIFVRLPTTMFTTCNHLYLTYSFLLFLVEKGNSTYTVENFTFFKEPIGMDSTQEILRYAKTRRVGHYCETKGPASTYVMTYCF